MPYITPGFKEIRQRMLRDVQNLDADAHIANDSDNFVRASVTASAIEGLYDFQQWIARQIIPDTADSEFLEKHCALRGIVRKTATKAVGTLYLLGEKDAEIPLGTLARDDAGNTYQTTAFATITTDDPAIYTPVPCESVHAAAVEDAEDISVTLLSAPVGVQGLGLVDISGGTNRESDAELLARLLFYMQNPPGGGSASDYKLWAESVDGVVSATVYPLRQGAGTVDIVITGADGVPDAAVVAACQAYIDSVRPVTARMVTVFAPIPQSVSLTFAITPATGQTLQSLYPTIRDVLLAEFALFAPGQAVILSRMAAIVAGIVGVVDVAVVQPQSNVIIEALSWARLGDVILESI